MGLKIYNSIVFFLILLVANLAISMAGGLVCPPGCPDCQIVPECCAKMGIGQESAGETGGTSGHSQCDHGGICLNGLQPQDAEGYAPALDIKISFSSTVQHVQPCIDRGGNGVTRLYLQPPLAQFPSLIIRHCSFLI